jgi:hypothetical protein
MHRSSLVALAAGLLAVEAGAAPAPFPRWRSPAEVVLVTRTEARARALLRFVRNDAFLREVLHRAARRRPGCLDGIADRRRWLAGRLVLEPLEGGKLVRVRLTDCSGPDGAVLLDTAIDVIRRVPPPFTRHGEKEGWEAEREKVRVTRDAFQQRLLRLKRLQAVRAIRQEEVEETEKRYADCDIEADPPTVRSPRGRHGAAR